MNSRPHEAQGFQLPTKSRELSERTKLEIKLGARMRVWHELTKLPGPAMEAAPCFDILDDVRWAQWYMENAFRPVDK